MMKPGVFPIHKIGGALVGDLAADGSGFPATKFDHKNEERKHEHERRDDSR